MMTTRRTSEDQPYKTALLRATHYLPEGTGFFDRCIKKREI
jgi:hypothetical protein